MGAVTWHSSISAMLAIVQSCRQGWWAWGLSALGYPATKGDESPHPPEGLPSGFTEADMQELRTALSLDSFDSQHGTDAKEPARKLEISADVKVVELMTLSSLYDEYPMLPVSTC